MYQYLSNQITLILVSILILMTLQVSASSHADIKQICQPFNSITSVDWQLPKTSPKSTPDKVIAFVASDMRNGGVEKVATGVAEALKLVGWHLVIFDGKGTDVGQATAILKAQLIGADGFILGGVDEKQQYEYIKKLSTRGKPIVGWHSAESVELADNSLLFANITTSAADVGAMAACYAIKDYPQDVKAIIFTDNDFSIARIKTQAMVDIFEKCQRCELLSVENISISRERTSLSKKIYEILENNKDSVTHFIAINDLYFDYLQAILDVPNASELPKSISAGDGSREAYRRIRTGLYQQATVPEPLLLQAWQIVDELNRAFNKQNSSQYSAPLVLVDKENINVFTTDSDIFEPGIDYRSHFKALWLEK